MRVCRSCYQPVEVRVAPGQGFVCGKCFVPQKDCKREKRKKRQAKRKEEKNVAATASR